MLIAVVPVKDIQSAQQQIAMAQDKADGIELRLDFLPALNFNNITALRQGCRLPVIFTLRGPTQGGVYPHSEEQRLKDLLALAVLSPDYIDLEHDVSKNFVHALHGLFPHIKLICSYHNFIQTPHNLSAVLDGLAHPNFSYYKIAAQANSSIDALRMLSFVSRAKKNYKLTGLCMGEEGQGTRIAGPIVGNAMQYACLAPEFRMHGQLTLDELIDVYRVRKLNSATKIYALLGDPVGLSVGHVLHNGAIEFLQQNAVYIKFRVEQHQLPSWMEEARRLPFAGFSITTPLKMSVLPLLDEICPLSCPVAVNSMIVQDKKYIGFNTDGDGALKALLEKTSLRGKALSILGAGGAACAIAHAARQHKIKAILMARDVGKAEKLARALGCQAMGLDHARQMASIDHAALINTLPEGACPTLAVLPQRSLPAKMALDVLYRPYKTAFLQSAQKANYTCVPGHEMYVHQALLQIKRWHRPDQSQLDAIKTKMQHYFINNFVHN